MVMGALYAKSPNFVDAFLKLMETYGTILAGIPVLIAVVVAKQQLDANRSQHVATIKRSLKKELDALEALDAFATDVIEFSITRDELNASLANGSGVHFYRPSKRQLELWSEVCPSTVTTYAKETWVSCGTAMDMSRTHGANLEEVSKNIRFTRAWAHPLRRHVRTELDRLSQFWS